MRNASEWGITRRKVAGDFSLKEFSQPPGRRLPWHEHAQASICYVVAGAYTEVVRGKSTACPPRAMVLKPPAERHSDHFGTAGATCLLIEIDPRRLASLDPVSRVTQQPRLARSARLTALGARLYDEFQADDVCAALALEGLILEVLAEASRAQVDESGTREPVWLRHARELLREDLRGSISLTAVARAVGIHPSHLARTFRVRLHCTMGDYVRRLRIERAARELAETNVPVTAVALRLGFYDQSHFSRLFKRYTGSTPAQVRSASASTRLPAQN